MTFPNIVREQGFIEVLLEASEKDVSEIPVEFVLDFDRFKEVIGIEILDLAADAGNNCLHTIEKSAMNFSYDEESDAFYLRLNEGASLDQEAVEGLLLMGNEGQIIGFRASFAN